MRYMTHMKAVLHDTHEGGVRGTAPHMRRSQVRMCVATEALQLLLAEAITRRDALQTCGWPCSATPPVCSSICCVMITAAAPGETSVHHRQQQWPSHAAPHGVVCLLCLPV